MQIINANNFWDSLKASVGEDSIPEFKIDYRIVEAVRKDKYPSRDTANILGEDSGLLFSNRFLYDPKSHKEIVDKVGDIKKNLRANFESTNYGKRLESVMEDAEAIKQHVLTGKSDKGKNKVEKRNEHRTSEEEAAILEEIEEAAQKDNKTKSTSLPGKSSPSSPTVDVKELVKKLVDEIKIWCSVSKKWAINDTIEEIEATIEHIDSYRGDTLGETYRRIVVPKDGTNVLKLEDAYMKVGQIMENESLKAVVGNTEAYKELNKFFRTTAQMEAEAANDGSLPNGGADFLEIVTGCDEFAKQIFAILAEQVKTKGYFTGKMGSFKITETADGNFSINEENISRNSLDAKYEEFVEILERANVNAEVVKYFRALLEREDIGSELNKYICLKFLKLLSSDLKKQNLANVYKRIDQEFAGTEFINLFKNIVKNLEYFTPSIENVENERVKVDANADVQIYEANGDYYAILYYGSLPPKRFALERLGHRGYSNYVVKGLSTNRAQVMQDLYKKIMEIQIRNEVFSHRIQDPMQSQYKDSKYFGQIMQEIEGESSQYKQVSSRLSYRTMKKLSQFYGSEGHPAYGDDPLVKFSLSAVFQNSVTLFIDFTRTSDKSFRINGVQFASGDRTMASRLINLLNNKSGEYSFNTNNLKDLSSVPEAQRQEIYRKITAFYTQFLDKLVAGIGKDEIPAQPPTAQQAVQAPEQKKYSREELVAIYNEYNALSDKDKRTPAEEKRLAEVTEIVSDNIHDIKRFLGLHDDDDLDELMEQTNTAINTIPKYEQNKLIRQLNALYDKLEGGASPKEQGKIQEEIDKITKFLVERGDFSKYRNAQDGIEGLEENLLDLSVADVNPSMRTKESAIILLKNSPFRQEYKENARKNLEKYPHLKSYLENIYSPEFVRLVYAD